MSQLDEKFKEWFYCVDYVSKKMTDKMQRAGGIVDKIHQLMAIYYYTDDSIDYLHKVRFLNEIDELSLFPITSLITTHHWHVFIKTVQHMHLVDIDIGAYGISIPTESPVVFEIEFHKGDKDEKKP